MTTNAGKQVRLPEVMSSQELYCFLLGYLLVRPTRDDWQSLKEVVTIFLDCWWTDSPEFRTDGLKMAVFDQDGLELIRLEYLPDGHPDDSKYSLVIKFNDPDEDDGFYGDTYEINWSE